MNQSPEKNTGETVPSGKSPAGIPSDLIPVAALGLAFVAYTIWNQAFWWSSLEENWFGWLTPLFSALVLLDRRARIAAAWSACGAPGSPRTAGSRGTLLNAAVTGCFALGLVAFLAGAIHRAGGGPSLKGTFVTSCGMTVVLLSLPWLAAPRPVQPAPADIRGDARWRVLGCLVFPAAIWILSAPLIAIIELQLSLFLLGPMMELISFVFTMMGLPVLREGNILIMPDHGRLGVEEACSGIRSLTACLFAGSFLGSLILKRFWQKTALVVAATALALAMNLARGLFLAIWAYRNGTKSIAGTVHDAAGYAVLALTTAGLFGLLALFNRPVRKYRSGASSSPAPARDRS